MSEQQPQMSEAELRAAYEAQLEEQLRRLRVEDVLVQTIITLLNLGGRRTGLAPGTEEERDPEQVRMAVEGARALLPLVDALLGPDAAPVREGLSQLQLAYARLVGAGGEPAAGAAGGPPPAPGTEPPAPGGPGPAQSSGRIWVPGQR